MYPWRRVVLRNLSAAGEGRIGRGLVMVGRKIGGSRIAVKGGARGCVGVTVGTSCIL